MISYRNVLSMGLYQQHGLSLQTHSVTMLTQKFTCHMCDHQTRLKTYKPHSTAVHHTAYNTWRTRSDRNMMNMQIPCHSLGSYRISLFSTTSSYRLYQGRLLKLLNPSLIDRHPYHMMLRHFCDYHDLDDVLPIEESVDLEGQEYDDNLVSSDKKLLRPKLSASHSKSKNDTGRQGKIMEEQLPVPTTDDLEYDAVTPATSSLKTSKRRRHVNKVTQTFVAKKVINGDMQPVTSTQIKDYLQKNEIAFTDGHTCYITTCPRYVRRRMTMKQMNKMFINMTTGYFVCLSCMKNGSWNNFVENTDHVLSISKNSKIPECFSAFKLNNVVKDSSRGRQIWDSCVSPCELPEEDLQNAKHVLGIEHLALEVLEKYEVRFFKDKNGIALPHFGLDGSLCAVKTIAEEMITVQDQERVKIVTKYYSSGDFDGLFGVNTIESRQKEVVLTTTEFDAMAVKQATGLLALALPKKDSILPQKVLPLLEQFNKLILWFGGNLKMWESAKVFSKKLNPNRCHLIRPDEKHPSALLGLAMGLKLKSILKDTQPVVHKSITSFRLLRQDVFNQLAEAEQVAGIKWNRYVQLNKILKGHRRGELTIITGPTGSGKTTFISDYSLDLCMQGVNTLWGSFEINNVRLMKTMLVQYSQINLVKHLDQFDHWADQFQQLPMHFMTFHGQENIQNVIETMSHAVYVHDIAHVIVDNLQFMMGSDTSNSSHNAASERFIKQDHIVGAFRQFATNKNCHVTMVIHPRKERETEELTISSIFGGAKASQEADNIMIIQDRRAVTVKGRKYVQISKNRFDGELGIMLLKFDKETLRYNVKPQETKKEKDDDDDTPTLVGQSVKIPAETKDKRKNIVSKTTTSEETDFNLVQDS